MRNILLLFVALLFGYNAQATNRQYADSVFSIADQMPEFKGGVMALNKFIAKNLRPIEEVVNLGLKARVYVKFVVNAHGRIEQAEIVRTSYRKPKNKNVSDEAVEKALPKIEAEALRFVSNLPPWNPALHQGKRVAVHSNIPLVFKPQ